MRTAWFVAALALVTVVADRPAGSDPGCTELSGDRVRCGGMLPGRGRSDPDIGTERPARGRVRAPGRADGRDLRESDPATERSPACLRDVIVIPRPDRCGVAAPAVGSPPGAPPLPAPDPAVLALELARSFWYETSLPHPKARIAPGWAITGKRAYLEVDMPLDRRFEHDTPMGPLVVRSSARITVDWGDGARTRAVRSQGGPWPGGDLTHTWTDAGAVDVVVRAGWTAQWTLGPYAGSLQRLSTSAVIDDFPVREVQAVRTR